MVELISGVGDDDQYRLDLDTYLSEAAVDVLMGESDEDWFLVDDASEANDLDAAETATDLSP